MEPDRLTEVVTVDEASKPAVQPTLTRKQVGELRRRYLTVHHGRVKACEHLAKFGKDRPPRNNCVECWTAFFMTSVDLEGVHVILTTQGVRALTAMRGKKFVKMFHGFLTSRLLPSLTAEAEQLVPADPAVIIEGGLHDGRSEALNQNTEILSPEPVVEAIGQEARHDELTGTTGEQEHNTSTEHTVGTTDSRL